MPKEQGEIERFRCEDFQPGPSEVVFIADGSGEWVKHSDHLERVEERERERDQYREGWLTRGKQINEEGADLRDRTERAEARADALQALLSEAVEELERRADEKKASRKRYAESEDPMGLVNAACEMGAQWANDLAASYLQKRLDALGTGGTFSAVPCPTCGSPCKARREPSPTGSGIKDAVRYVPVRGGANAILGGTRMSETITEIRRFEGPCERYGTEAGFEVVTTAQTIKLAIDDDASCCESWGYFFSEDDTEKFIGADLRGVEITDTNRSGRVFPMNWKQGQPDDAIHLDEGDTMFVDLKTDRGILQFVAYNSHNGYYGHEARVSSTQLEHSKAL